MASLDSLPADQRAVLQLVLQRGRGYDEIAKMLNVDRAGVRERALAAFDALGPHTRVPPERRALITDYLLGQLPERVSEQTRDRLGESASERAWARVLASELAPLASEPLPEIPVDSGHEEPVETGASVADEAETIPGDDGVREPEPAGARPSSRRGGAMLLGIGALVVIIAVVIVVIASGGSSKKHATHATTVASTPAGTTSTNGTQLIAQVNLVSPAGTKKTAGVAQVIRQGANTGLVIVAQGVPANTSHDAYAVWLYNSPADSHILGFVNPGVKTDGKLQTAGVLPTNASHYKQLLVTLETQAKPHGPGKIVLEGALTLS
jgi:Sigma-70, region 4